MKIRHYGHILNEVCFLKLLDGKKERVAIVALDFFDNNRCYVKFLDGLLKGKETFAVCEWLESVGPAKGLLL